MPLESAFARYDRESYGAGYDAQRFMEAYGRRPVVCTDGTVGIVDIHKYRLDRADPKQFDPDKRIRDQAADTELTAVMRHLRGWCARHGQMGQGVRRWVREGRVTNIFKGKGSPKDCSLLLAILLESGRIRDEFPRGREIAAAQAYCDKYIGIDCSGFVNAYFIAKSRFTDSLASRRVMISAYADRRRRLDAVPLDPRDHVLAWDDFKHIALIDAAAPGSDRFFVVESSASFGGLRRSIYRVTHAATERDEPWTFLREQQGSTQDVYLAPPLPPR